MTTVSYDYGLSDESFTLFNEQEYFIDSGCLNYDRVLPFPWQVQRMCVHDHVDTRDYLTIKLIFDLS